MDTLNNNPKETEAAPAPVPSPAASSPEAAAAPAPEAGKNLAPQTKGNVPGGWNRFAGYKPGEAKNKQKDRRDSRGRR